MMLKEHGELPKEYRFGLAKEAFAHTAADVAIANYMSGVLDEGPTPPEYLSAYEKVTDLRYGRKSASTSRILQRNWYSSWHGGFETTTWQRAFL